MKNNKGFTLVEIIVAIAIMALLILILVPSVFTMINKNNEKSCNSLKDNIISAAKMYVTYNKYDLDFSCNTTKSITLETLVNSGDLKSNENGIITNPVDDTIIPLTSTVSVTYNCNNNTFEYAVNDIDCIK